MEDEKSIAEIYESVRCLLLSTESIGNSINELKNDRLKNYLNKILQCLQSEGLILTDLLFEISTCIDDSDIDSLIDCAADDDFEEPKFEVN